MAESVYIHIPFCKSKCKYCSFISFSDIDNRLGYLYSLLKEIDTNYNGEKLKTLYFGGGTPSLMEISHLKKILNKFNLSSDCEITFEMNPDDANPEYLEKLIDIGINRLSIGAQTFSNNILKLIGRRHSYEQTLEAVKNAKNKGFKNISLDLMYGLPEQTIEILKNDLDIIASLEIQHVSTYGLKIEEESYFGKHHPHNLPNDDIQADMYILINNFLSNIGYNRYEISNFSLPNFESNHNLNYWNNSEYYGFGIAAHGYIDGIRYSNSCNLSEYLNNPTRHNKGHIVTKKEKLEEELFLGFRKESGINTELIYNRFGIIFEDKYKDIINKFSPKFIIKTDSGYKLTLDGILLSNNILAEFIEG